MSEQNATFTEAPASWNCKYTSSHGFDCMLTLRAGDPLELLKTANAIMAKMAEAGVKPAGNGHAAANGNGGGQPAASDNPAWCVIHGCEMRKHEKNGETWYSHKGPDGGWCNGRPAKK